MTRKDASRQQRLLRERGVYKPYVSKHDDAIIVESYPLTARITMNANYEQTIKIIDYSSRVNGMVPTVATVAIPFGTPAADTLCPLLVALHPEAYARAKAQDAQHGV